MALHIELAKCSTVESGPFFTLDTPEDWLRQTLPDDYLEIANKYGGREGFLGQQYVRLYRPQELRALNDAYEISSRRPGLIMVASDGYGEGFGFLHRNPAVLKFPLIPLPIEGEIIDLAAATFEAFVHLHSETSATMRPNPSCVGMEMHLKQPLCFGGDWRSSENQVLVPPLKHAELVCYWNTLYRKLLAQQQVQKL